MEKEAARKLCQITRLWYNKDYVCCCAESKGSPEIPGNCRRDTHDTDLRDTKIFLSVKTDDQQ